MIHAFFQITFPKLGGRRHFHIECPPSRCQDHRNGTYTLGPGYPTVTTFDDGSFDLVRGCC